MTQQQTNFLNGIGVMTGRQRRQEDFDTWMRDKVKSVFYFDNDKMTRAIETIE
jgi:hypothetical protein